MIRLEAIRKSFGGTPILEGVDLEVQEGETLVLFGASGAGKSLLLYLVAGLIRPDSGQIDRKSNRIGMVFQKNALFDSMTVGENLAFPLQELTPLSRDSIEIKVREYLTHFELSDWYDAPISSLSGGMQKRLALARALIAEPEFLLCDSPTAGLDPITARHITALLAEKCAHSSMTTIIATHDVRQGLSLADRVALLFNGRISFIGMPQHFLSSAHPSIAAFLNGGSERRKATHKEPASSSLTMS